MIALILLVAFIVLQLAALTAAICRRDGTTPLTRQFWL